MASRDGQPGSVWEHHVPKAVCDTRAKYREGRRPRAVKVYTINLESRYLLVQGVPALGAMRELVERFALYGAIEQYNALDEYPAEEFTEVYLIKFLHLHSARTAKRKMDEQSFFGGLLHVCYAPEFETVEETRRKLAARKAYVGRSTRSKGCVPTKPPPPPQPGDADPCSPDLPSGGAVTCAAALDPSAGRSRPLPCSCQRPLCSFAAHRAGAPGQPLGGGAGVGAGDPWLRDSAPSPRSAPGAAPSSAAVDRFLPRSTQLQERQRRREDDRKRGADPEPGPGGRAVVIGPLLPQEPEVDLHDASLNATAALIRRRLREVMSPVPEPSGDRQGDVHAGRPPKQRRRI
ncbi:RNA-binding protein 48-like [Lepus europaeus]|uniref:RNA-binding protein 48-like n=1 Tax=Lepus europaeus TaxID=9983 RepID=UPI002B48252C|nr:RNA-binding protein 48-like [Lepus europaeus]